MGQNVETDILLEDQQTTDRHLRKLELLKQRFIRQTSTTRSLN
jgi:hypothetical protein